MNSHAPSFCASSTIIAFDLHDVLIHHDYKKMIGLWWRSPVRWSLMINLMHPILLWKVLKMRRHHVVAEKQLIELIKQFPRLKQYQSLGIKLLNAQKLDFAALSLLQNLKRQGYTLHLFSNIGQQLYADLAPQFSELISLFDAIHVAQEHNQYLAKPYPQAFYNYLSKHNPDGKLVIFVDDKAKNTHAASACGIHAIRFKSIKKLTKTLTTILNIFEKSPHS